MLDASRTTVVGVIDELWDAGAQGVILGCTELELLVKQADCELPVFPCTTLHVEAALDRALAELDPHGSAGVGRRRRRRRAPSPARPRTTRSARSSYGVGSSFTITSRAPLRTATTGRSAAG